MRHAAEAIGHLDAFLVSEIPEMEAIPAIRELRWQFSRPKVEAKAPYPGKRSGIDPIKYMLDHYGDEIRSGALGPGRLCALDNLLYISARNDLLKRTPPTSLGDFFAAESHGRAPGTMGKLRYQAFAKILGVGVAEAQSIRGHALVDQLLGPAGKTRIT